MMRAIAGSLVVLLLSAGCPSASAPPPKPVAPKPMPGKARAHAVLIPAEGSTVNGTFTLMHTTEGISVTVRLAGGAPGSYTVHLLASEDCPSGKITQPPALATLTLASRAPQKHVAKWSGKDLKMADGKVAVFLQKGQVMACGAVELVTDAKLGGALEELPEAGNDEIKKEQP